MVMMFWLWHSSVIGLAHIHENFVPPYCLSHSPPVVVVVYIKGFLNPQNTVVDFQKHSLVSEMPVACSLS